MTRINLKKDMVFGYRELTVSGHSGYADKGSDIICSYISSATELLMSILIDEVGADIESDINPENATIVLRVLPTSENEANAVIISAVFGGFKRQMEEFSKQFHKFVSIKID